MSATDDRIQQMAQMSDRRYEQRFEAQEKAVSAALAAAEKAVTAALTAADRAVAKAEAAAERRFEGVNEFRQALNDSQARNITRTEVDAKLQALVEKVDANSARIDRAEAAKLGIQESRTESRAGLSLTVATVTVVVTLILSVLTIISFVVART